MTSSWGDSPAAIRAAILEGCLEAEAEGFVWCHFSDVDAGLKAEAEAMAAQGLVYLDPEFDRGLEDCLSVARVASAGGGDA